MITLCVSLTAFQGYKWKPFTYELQAVENANASCAAVRPPAEPCSSWFPGNRPFQAPEVNNIANFVSKLPDLEAFIDLRSYGQMRTPSSSPLYPRVS